MSAVEVAAVAMQSAATIASQSPAGEQPAQQGAALARALGAVDQAEPGRLGGVGRGRRRAAARSGAAACAVSFAVRRSFASPASRCRQVSSGLSSRAFSRSARRRGRFAGLVLDLRAQVVELPVAVLAFDRLAEPFDRASGIRPGARRAGRAARRARRPRARSSGRCRRGRRRWRGRRRRRRCWLASISRSTSSGPIRAIAAIQATRQRRRRRGRSGAFAPGRRRRAAGGELRAAGGDQRRRRRGRRPRPSAGDLPEPVEAGADREGEHRREAAPRRARAAAPAAARQAAKPVQSSDPTRPRTSRPPTRPSSANTSR